MKTVLVVILYAAFVGALNLGGAIWTSLRAGQPTAQVAAVSGQTEDAHR